MQSTTLLSNGQQQRQGKQLGRQRTHRFLSASISACARYSLQRISLLACNVKVSQRAALPAAVVDTCSRSEQAANSTQLGRRPMCQGHTCRHLDQCSCTAALMSVHQWPAPGLSAADKFSGKRPPFSLGTAARPWADQPLARAIGSANYLEVVSSKGDHFACDWEARM
jgi:hypothetical protein